MKIVHSSNGDLTINDNGEVIPAESFYDNNELRDIVKFDLEEFKLTYPAEADATEFDILDLGYWLSNGYYEPPDLEWREFIKEEILNDRRRQTEKLLQ